MTDQATDVFGRPHRLAVMRGRDHAEPHRAATPLELLFDLTFVVAFSFAGNELAHALAEGYLRDAVIGFGFSTLAICWAWVNYAWFASAYDTDDWLFRLLTMVQMVGVLILALGIPEVFSSIHDGALDARVVVAGYVVMRVAMMGQWLRAWIQYPEARASAQIYLVFLGLAQILWVIWCNLEVSLGVALLLYLVPITLELICPVIAERRGSGTPWHPHHIAERYGLLTIITLGEVILGTVVSIEAIVHNPDLGWTTSTAVVAIAGVGLCFGMWWMYFTVPSAILLQHHRRRAASWAYWHIPMFASIAATGGSLHAVAYYIEDHSKLGATGTVAAVVIPVALFTLALTAVYTALVRTVHFRHSLGTLASFGILALALLVAGQTGNLPFALALVALAPVLSIVIHELDGHRAMAQAVRRSLAESPDSVQADG